jgi:molybdopterin synthase catalytic subunit
LQPSEQIVLVMVGSAHRDAAFAAAEFIMDYLKTKAVLWKRELSDAGEVWLESTAQDATRAENWQQN